MFRLFCESEYFFFQAEDGIRDYKVTGVQTCALPIWLVTLLLAGAASKSVTNRALLCAALAEEIGRASCRERATTSWGAAERATTKNRRFRYGLQSHKSNGLRPERSLHRKPLAWTSRS